MTECPKSPNGLHSHGRGFVCAWCSAMPEGSLPLPDEELQRVKNLNEYLARIARPPLSDLALRELFRLVEEDHGLPASQIMADAIARHEAPLHKAELAALAAEYAAMELYLSATIGERT